MYNPPEQRNCIMSQDLEKTASTLVARGKGILAADETVPTLTRRFDALGIPSTEQTRCTYREMLFTTPGAADRIGVTRTSEKVSFASAGRSGRTPRFRRRVPSKR